ncbi:MAG: P1 family peptidase [Oscillochloris sp.]|nr:P1 family peptidase [Oscillochloris sp.]
MPPAITDVAGLLVGHAQNDELLTGVTVVLTPEGAVGGVDVRGGAPGTRETDLLDPTAMVQQVHAVALCGGSAVGLAAAGGVVDWLREHGHGFDTPFARIPIVPGAVIFDLGIGQAGFPDATMGRAACEAAGNSVAEGCVGVGIGATVGKVLGIGGAMKGGVGSWSERLPDGTTVGALVVVNAYGDVWAEHGPILAGARDENQLVDTMQLLRQPALQAAFRGSVSAKGVGQNTTLAVIATDATLTKAEASKIAQMAQDGLARTIRPVHTPFDGDTVFALATGKRPAQHPLIIGALAADVLARAVERAVQSAVGLGGLPAARDLPPRE